MNTARTDHDRPLVPSRDELQRRAARDFVHATRHLMIHRGQTSALSGNAAPRIQTILKAVVAGGTLAGDDSLAAYGDSSAAWLASLRQNSAFDAMLPAMKPASMLTRFAVSTQSFVADEVAEAAAKPVAALTLAPVDALRPRKCAVILVVTQEQARTSDATSLIDAELRGGIAVGTDTLFLADIISSTTPIPSAGSSAANTQTDVDALLAAVEFGAQSRPFFVFSPAAIKKLLSKTASGQRIWPDLTWAGGMLSGIPTLVSDGLPAGTALLLDATGVAATPGEIRIDSSTVADIEMSDSPTMTISAGSPAAPTAAQIVSMFQVNGLAAKGERTFAFKLLRDDAAASLSGVSY